MMNFVVVPSSLESAANSLRFGFAQGAAALSNGAFIQTWCAISYLYPGLHPDGFDAANSGWPNALRPFAAEAWRRFSSGEFSEDELYCSDAQWAGIFDRML